MLLNPLYRHRFPIAMITDLVSRVASINAKHDALPGLVNKTRIEVMIEIGRELLPIREEKVRDRTWGSWAKDNLHFDIRTARRDIEAYEAHQRGELETAEQIEEFLREVNGHRKKKRAQQSDAASDLPDGNIIPGNFQKPDLHATATEIREALLPIKAKLDTTLFTRALVLILGDVAPEIRAIELLRLQATKEEARA